MSIDGTSRGRSIASTDQALSATVERPSTVAAQRRVFHATQTFADEPNELPPDWRVVPFEDAVFFQEGPGIRNWQYRESGIPFVNIRCLVDGRLDRDRMNCLDPDEVDEKYQHFLLDAGDYVVSSSGTIGRIAEVTQSDLPCMLNTSVIRMRPHESSIIRRYLRYFLASHHFQLQVRQYAAGSVQMNYGPTHLRKMWIVVPPRSEQSAIAHILGTLDDKIELNRRMNEAIEAMARALYKSWFVDFEPVRARIEGRDTGLPQSIAALFPTEISRADVHDAPVGWSAYSLNDIAVHHTSTVSPSATPDAPFEHYSIPAHDAGQTPTLELGLAIKSNKTLVPHDAVLLSKLNPDIPRVWAPSDPQGVRQVCSTEFLAFAPSAPGNRSLLFSLFSDDQFRTMLRSLVTGTSKSHQRVPPKSLKTQFAIAGEPSAFNAFDSLAKPWLNRVIANRVESQSLAQIRDLLLPRLISGEIRAAQAEEMVEAATRGANE